MDAIEQASDIAKEYYLSLTFDRGAKQPLFMFTTQGGVEIEQVAEENPEALVRLHAATLNFRDIIMAKGLAKPGADGYLSWKIESTPAGGVTINAASAKGVTLATPLVTLVVLHTLAPTGKR